MKLFKRIVLWGLLALMAFFAISVARNWDTIQRVFLGGLKVYESAPPKLPDAIKRPAILIFSKTNGFRHVEAIPAASAMFRAMATRRGWGIFETENGATFSPEILARFDAVVFSNTSGDVFTPKQREAFKGFVENGGGYVGMHAAGDNSHAAWTWYTAELIGANFIGHPMDPQFQKATLNIEDRTHPATKHLSDTWARTDEWYSYDKSPRKPGLKVLATLDEATYKPGSFGLFGKGTSLAMGKDHPAIWTHCVGKGRVLYSILGHTAETFVEPENVQSLEGSLNWALKLEGPTCDVPPILTKGLNP